MKIGYFADGIWAHKTIEKIVSNEDFEISFIVPRYASPDPILKSWAHRLGIDFLPLKQINSSSSQNLLKKYNVDIFVSMSFDQIFKKDFHFQKYFVRESDFIFIPQYAQKIILFFYFHKFFYDFLAG